MIEIDNVYISGGVNQAGAPFCTISFEEKGRLVSVTQMPPREVRQMALQWLCGAEAAEQDAAVYAVMRGLDLPDQAIGAIIADMRERRSKPPFDTTGT